MMGSGCRQAQSTWADRRPVGVQSPRYTSKNTEGDASVNLAPSHPKYEIPTDPRAAAQWNFMEADRRFRDAAKAVEDALVEYEKKMNRVGSSARSVKGGLSRAKLIKSQGEAESFMRKARQVQSRLKQYDRSEKKYVRAFEEFDLSLVEFQWTQEAYFTYFSSEVSAAD